MNENQNRQLSKLIDDVYGSPEELANHLDLGIEMLFYIEEDTFEKRDVQRVVFSIRAIINVLRKTE